MLNKINQNSITEIVFLNKDINNIKLKSYFNIIFAGNGVFYVLNNELGMAIEKLNIPYTNTKLKNIDKIGFIYKLGKKIPIQMFYEIIEIFRYVGKQGDEFMVNIWFNKKTEQFELEIPEDQLISAASVNYNNTKTKYNDLNYIFVANIHSHHTMSASFSGVDNKDENKKTLVVYGVIGRINNPIPEFSFRIWNGFQFVELPIDTIFDIELNKGISKSIKNKIDKIIKTNIEKQKTEATRHFDRFGSFYNGGYSGYTNNATKSEYNYPTFETYLKESDKQSTNEEDECIRQIINKNKCQFLHEYRDLIKELDCEILWDIVEILQKSTIKNTTKADAIKATFEQSRIKITINVDKFILLILSRNSKDLRDCLTEIADTLWEFRFLENEQDDNFLTAGLK